MKALGWIVAEARMDLEIVVSAESEWGAGDACEHRQVLVLA